MPALTIRASRSWTVGRALVVALLYLAAFALGGVRPAGLGVEYHVFDLVDGLAALLVLYVLLNTEALSWPRDAWGGVVLVYAGVATAQLVALLLPPPGVLEWLALGALILFAWNAAYGVHRTRVMLGLGLVALALALLRYSLLPFVWEATQLPQTPLVDLRALGEGFKRTFIAYEPPGPATQLFALAAIVAWTLAVWLGWPPESEDAWVRRLPRAQRDLLLQRMLADDAAEVRRRLEGGGHGGEPGGVRTGVGGSEAKGDDGAEDDDTEVSFPS